MNYLDYFKDGGMTEWPFQYRDTIKSKDGNLMFVNEYSLPVRKESVQKAKNYVQDNISEKMSIIYDKIRSFSPRVVNGIQYLDYLVGFAPNPYKSTTSLNNRSSSFSVQQGS